MQSPLPGLDVCVLRGGFCSLPRPSFRGSVILSKLITQHIVEPVLVFKAEATIPAKTRWWTVYVVKIVLAETKGTTDLTRRTQMRTQKNSYIRCYLS